jgi:hypothetical protein
MEIHDNWGDRLSRMICKTCRFFVPKQVPEYSMGGAAPEAQSQEHPPRLGIPPIHYDLGRCRRHAPTLRGWPVVYNTDWCGDHKLSEYTYHFLFDGSKPA